MVAMLQEKQMYVAWKFEGRKIAVQPEVGKWPRAARLELKEWAKGWK